MVLLNYRLTSVAALALLASFGGLAQADESAKEVRVLFIGNSQVYYNDLPRMVEALAASAAPGRPRVRAERLVKGGASLESHWNAGAGAGTARAKIVEAKWDVVVLQEIFNARPESFAKHAPLFHELIQKNGSRTVLLATASINALYPKGFHDLHAMHVAMGKKLDVPVAAAGKAWLTYWGDNPTVEQRLTLYDADKAHPGKKGSYIYACTLYPLLTGSSPVGLGHQLPKLVETITPAEAKEFQEAAWKVHRALNAAAQSRGEVPMGTTVARLQFTDIRTLPRTLDDFGKKKAFVLVFTSTGCPLVQRYLPTLRALAREYRDKDVQFVALNAAEEDTLIAMATQAVRHEVDVPFVKDFGGVCARAPGVRRTPEAVVLDADRRLCYRGRIDDQYRLGGVCAEPTRRDLKEALDAVLAGRQVANPETAVDGCPITLPRAREPLAVNYAAHVAPLLQKHCWQCHQAGGSAPFALTSFKQASARADALAEVVTDQRMPPWFASHEFGPFVNRRGLADEERQTLVDWARSGAAPGDLSKAPAPPRAPESEWLIGTPDLLLRSTEMELPATGDIPYRYAVLPHIFTEDTWVQGVQIVPDNRRVLHHCNMAFATLTEGFNEENFITGYVPGGAPMALDNGVGFCIPKGAVLGLQIHFVATGKAEKCRVAVGLRYPREVVEQRLRNIQLTDRRFAIPPGVPAHKVAASKVLDRDVIGVGLFAHMHLRGKDMTFKAHGPDGTTETLLIIPNYNFSWQVPYKWEANQKRLPKGTRLECIAHYDNSPFNPYNPNPLATVRNGPQTYHEMMYGFFFYTDAAEKLGLNVDPKTGRVRKE